MSHDLILTQSKSHQADLTTNSFAAIVQLEFNSRWHLQSASSSALTRKILKESISNNEFEFVNETDNTTEHKAHFEAAIAGDSDKIVNIVQDSFARFASFLNTLFQITLRVGKLNKLDETSWNELPTEYVYNLQRLVLYSAVLSDQALRLSPDYQNVTLTNSEQQAILIGFPDKTDLLCLLLLCCSNQQVIPIIVEYTTDEIIDTINKLLVLLYYMEYADKQFFEFDKVDTMFCSALAKIIAYYHDNSIWPAFIVTIRQRYLAYRLPTSSEAKSTLDFSLTENYIFDAVWQVINTIPEDTKQVLLHNANMKNRFDIVKWLLECHTKHLEGFSQIYTEITKYPEKRQQFVTFIANDFIGDSILDIADYTWQCASIVYFILGYCRAKDYYKEYLWGQYTNWFGIQSIKTAITYPNTLTNNLHHHAWTRYLHTLQGLTTIFHYNTSFKHLLPIIEEIYLRITPTTFCDKADLQPNQYAIICPICEQGFSLIISDKHHCRLCARVVCSTCASRKYIRAGIPNENKPERVCVTCNDKMDRNGWFQRLT